MIRSLPFAFCLLLFIPGLTVNKKEQLLLLSKKYFPENYTVLKEYDEGFINDLAHGDSAREFISDVSTIVHEGYHQYLGNHSSYFDSVMRYRINDTLSFSVRNFKTFPSKEINSIVSPAVQKKIFRYETYVNAKDKYHVTQQFGILGLLEECVAYYQSFATEIELFGYFRDTYGWKQPEQWMTYLANAASYRFAITEFELFISWYLQCAKAKHPTVYHGIVSNKELKRLFVFIEKENKRLTSVYNQNRTLIIKQCNGILEVKDNFIYNNRTHFGKGLYDNEVKEMDDLLQKPEHRILDELRN
jgi:hypothetical protein